jgi:formate dehydrogenase iron-sulfur subunit
MNLSRRDFLKIAGAGALTLGVGAKFAPPTLGTGTRSVPISPKVGNGVLIDATACVGCKSCQRACKIANNLPSDGREMALSATTLTIVDFKNISTKIDQPDIKPVKRQCMHCDEPACVSVCPVGALVKTASGAVTYDANLCMGCRYCMMACPFGVPKYNWSSPNPQISKCAQGCMANSKSDRPACVQACPNKALAYGKRDELLAMAHTRIAQNPTKYVNQVYGEKEIGGTSMLYLSSVPFEQLGFRTDLPNEPLPSLTWNAQEKIPGVLVTVATLLSGIAWWTHRRQAKQLVKVPVQVTSE